MASSDEPRFKCRECGRIAASAANLRVHMRTHTGEKPYECKECGKSYACQRSYKNHMGIHGGERPYQCSFCPKSFVISKSFKEHQRTHEDSRPFICSYCGKGFKYKTVLKSHLIIHTGEGPHKCAECGMCYNAPSRLKEHMRSHTNERPYVCDVCGDSFTKHSALSRHKVLHTGDRKHQCSLCKKKFIVPSELKVHMQAHSGKRHCCNFCDRTFKYKALLQKHLRYSDGKGPHVCSICTREFLRFCQLREHMKTHKGKQIYNCTKCEKNFTLITMLSEHIRKNHKSSKSRGKSGTGRCLGSFKQQEVAVNAPECANSYRCNICGLTVENEHLFKTHVAAHTYVNANNSISMKSLEVSESSLNWHNVLHHLENDDRISFESRNTQSAKNSIVFRSANIKKLIGGLYKTRRTENEYGFDSENMINETEDSGTIVHDKSMSYETSFTNDKCRENVLENSREKQHEDSDGSDSSISIASLTHGKINHVDQRLYEDSESDTCNYSEKDFELENIEETPYKCSICGLHFSTPNEFQLHETKEHGSKRLQACNVCGKHFTSFVALKKHQIHHAEGKGYKCKFCDRTFKIAAELKRHVCIHTNQLHSCNLCNKNFMERILLKRHKIQSENKGPRKCSVCFVTLKGFCQLKEHMKSHMSRGILKCMECNKTFMLEWHYREHMKYHSAAKTQQMLDTSHTVASNGHPNHIGILFNHIASDDCSKEDRLFGVENTLCNDNIVVENERLSVVTTDKDTEKLLNDDSHCAVKCESTDIACSERIFKNKRTNLSRRKIPVGIRFKCSECGKLSARFSDLAFQMSLDVEEIPYHCSDCDLIQENVNGKAFQNKNNSADVTTQPSEKNGCIQTTVESTIMKYYQCLWCDFSSVHSIKLRQHMRSHWQGVEPHQCSLCSLMFHSATSLELHKKTHTQLDDVAGVYQQVNDPPGCPELS